MGKKMVIGLLAALLCATSIEAQAQMAVRVTAERTSVREKAATDGAVVATVVKGEDLDVLETSGAWYRVRVRSTGREGFVHNLFVERAAGAASGPAPAAPVSPGTPPATAAPAARTTPPVQQPPTEAGFSLEDRHLGVGLTGGGLAFGFTPSFRYWTGDKAGFEVNASFTSNSGFSTVALSPSFLMRFNEPKRAGTVGFAPYWGAGITYYHFASGFDDFYCDIVGVDCDTSSIGFGGFGGTEILFDAVPKLAASANVGFYTSPSALNYGGLYLSFAGHWYFK